MYTHAARCSVYLGRKDTHTNTDPLTHVDVQTELMKGDHAQQKCVSEVDKAPTETVFRTTSVLHDTTL